MLITEIFRNPNYQEEDSDNGSCGKCHANFTVPFIAAKMNQNLACPNCGEGMNANDAIALKLDIDKQADTIDPSRLSTEEPR